MGQHCFFRAVVDISSGLCGDKTECFLIEPVDISI